MSGSGGDDRERNRKIARNAEKQQIIGNIRISTLAIVVAFVICAVLLALGWIAYRLLGRDAPAVWSFLAVVHRNRGQLSDCA